LVLIKRYEEERKILQAKPMNKENEILDNLNNDLDDDELDILLEDYSRLFIHHKFSLK
jgi:hypothetical protein